jgi:hypothetical protein
MRPHAVITAGPGQPTQALPPLLTPLSPPPPPGRRRRRPQDLPALWRKLKDAFVLPLLVAYCRAAGLQPPFGLLVVPWEVQLQILRLLPVRGRGQLPRTRPRPWCCPASDQWALEGSLL